MPTVSRSLKHIYRQELDASTLETQEKDGASLLSLYRFWR